MDPIRAKSYTMTIGDLLPWISDGKVRVPASFRHTLRSSLRAYLSLFDSIRLGFPIGLVVLWDTKEIHETYSNLGISLPPKGNDVLYLVDGYQRLAIIYEALLSENSLLGYDLRLKEFTYEAKPGVMSISYICRTTRYLQFFKSLQNLPGAEDLQREADRTANQILNYPIPIVQISNADLNQVKEAVRRLQISL